MYFHTIHSTLETFNLSNFKHNLKHFSIRMFVNDTHLVERDFLFAPFCPSSSPSSPATSLSSSELSSMDMN